MTMKLLTTRTVGLPKAVLDASGKPMKVTVTHRSRLIEVNAFDVEHIPAGKKIVVNDDIGADLLKAGAAREYDRVIDAQADEIDETDEVLA